MFNFRVCKTVALFGLFSVLVSFSSVARAETEISLSFSAIPQLREVVVAPEGYVDCADATPGYFDGYWHSARRICYYGTTPEAGIWISGHWGCARWAEDDTLVCNEWTWFPAHWVKRGYWEYGIRWHRQHPWFWWHERHRHYRPFPYHWHHRHHPRPFHDGGRGFPRGHGFDGRGSGHGHGGGGHIFDGHGRGGRGSHGGHHGSGPGPVDKHNSDEHKDGGGHGTSGDRYRFHRGDINFGHSGGGHSGGHH